MKSIKYSIDSKIFELFPNYTRGVIIISHLRNSETSSSLISNLKEIVNIFRKEIITSENLLQINDIILWRRAFKQLGFSSEYRPSFEALLRRVVNNPDGLKPISTLVDVGNLCSIKYHIPIGIHEICNDTTNIQLAISDGTETFIEFGKDEIEHPQKGEIVLIENENVLTRRWVWRQAKQSIITINTKNVFINIDCLDKTDESVLKLCNDISNLVLHYCGGESTIHLLKKDHNTLNVELQEK